MNLAKLSSNGQITVPVEIRRHLDLHPGDKMLFLRKSNGEIVVTNAALSALSVAQDAFAGAASDFGIDDEAAVQSLVDEVRVRRRSSS